MRPIADRLVLPYSIELEQIGTYEEYKAKDIKISYPPIFDTKHTGFTAPIFLEGNNQARYHLFRILECEKVSAIHALLKAKYGDEKTEKLFEHVPHKFEVNFILRNLYHFGKQKALPVFKSSNVLDWSYREMQEKLRDKIIFIGRFKSKKDQLSNDIDSFTTPVQSDMNGIYFLINAYLNIITDTFLKPANFGLVFIINYNV